jgi:hypothetical protein
VSLAPDDTNGRVTMAILATKLDHLTDEIRQYRTEAKEQLSTCRVESQHTHEDHEKRLRELEGSTRQGLYRDIAAFISALGAGVVSFIAGKAP